METVPSPVEATFGELLRHHRQATGLTQEELAARTGLSVRGLSDLERGARLIPRQDTLHLLIEALGLAGVERTILVAAAKRRSTSPLRQIKPDRGVPHLPVPLTPFVGRASEVATVGALLTRDDVRLVTLTGPGGVGKTRLALHVAQEIAGSFADGARFVDLAAVRNPDLVTTTVAQTLGLREMGGRPLTERLATLLRDQHLLLVLDNFEQVALAAPQVVALLATCPRLTALITSRSVLRVSCERAFPVPPLTLPQRELNLSLDQVATSEAVQLFVDRAQAIAPYFALDATNAPAVVDICRHLDGLPLAIALAAARVGHLPLAALLERLERRLPLLTGGPRDQPDRLRTMRDAIAWSQDLLTPHQQRLFRRLAVFAGGCTLEAAEAVCADEQSSPTAFADTVLEGLASLVDGSLIWHDIHAAIPRYRMLETIREYGLGLLAESGEAEVVRRRHAGWCLSFAERSSAALPGPDQRLWLEWTEVEHDNIRDALAWFLEQEEIEGAQRLTTAMHRFWYVRGYLSEGRTWAERALAGSLTTPPAARAGGLLTAGWLAWAQGDYVQAVEHVQASLRLYRDLDHGSGVAESIYILGMVAKDQDEYDHARELLMEALDLFREIGATQWMGFVLNALGIVAYERGDIQAATALFTEALAHFRTVGETNGTAYAMTNLGRMALAAGDANQAARYFQESLALRHKHGDAMSVAGCFRGLAIVAASRGEYEAATILLGAAEALRERIGLPQPRHHGRFDETVNACRSALGEERLQSVWQRGRELSLETAVEVAMQISRTVAWP